MHKTVENLILIQNEIKSKIIELNLNDYKPKIVAITKTFQIRSYSTSYRLWTS